MELVLCFSLLVLVSVNGAHGQCAGKCFPGNGQYEGRLVTVSNEYADEGEPSSLDILHYFAYDDVKQRFYARGINWDQDGHALHTEILQLNDRTPAVQYVVLNGTCREDRPDMVGIACVPASAKNVMSMSLGNPQNHIETHVYVSHEPFDGNHGEKLDGTVHVLMDDCNPVFYAMEGTDPRGQDVMMSFLVGNYKDHVDDPSVFDIPEGCPK